MARRRKLCMTEGWGRVKLMRRWFLRGALALAGVGALAPAASADETLWRTFRGRVTFSDVALAPQATFESPATMAAALRRIQRSAVEQTAGFWRLHLLAFLDRPAATGALVLRATDVTDPRAPREVRVFEVPAERGEKSCAWMISSSRRRWGSSAAPATRSPSRPHRRPVAVRRDQKSRKSGRVCQRGDNPEVVRALVSTAVLAVLTALAAPAPAASGSAGKSARTSRQPNPRTGRLMPAFAELVKAYKRGDRAALARVADRMGPVRLGEAVASRDPGVGEAALEALPLAHGGLLLIGAATEQIGVADWPRGGGGGDARSGRCSTARCRRRSRSGTSRPTWSRARATALRALAWRSDAAVATRLAALDAVARPRRAAVAGRTWRRSRGTGRGDAAGGDMVAAGAASARRCCATRSATRDRSVSAAATAAACRIEARTGQQRQGRAARRRRRSRRRARWRRPRRRRAEDAVEMLDCLAAAGTPADRALLDELQRRPAVAPARSRRRARGAAAAGKTVRTARCRQRRPRATAATAAAARQRRAPGQRADDAVAPARAGARAGLRHHPGRRRLQRRVPGGVPDPEPLARSVRRRGAVDGVRADLRRDVAAAVAARRRSRSRTG